jgi:hypothetical protein
MDVQQQWNDQQGKTKDTYKTCSNVTLRTINLKLSERGMNLRIFLIIYNYFKV